MRVFTLGTALYVLLLLSNTFGHCCSDGLTRLCLEQDKRQEKRMQKILDTHFVLELNTLPLTQIYFYSALQFNLQSIAEIRDNFFYK